MDPKPVKPEVKPIMVRMPLDRLGQIDTRRGDVPREAWIRRVLFAELDRPSEDVATA